jgi:hypothetical protein
MEKEMSKTINNIPVTDEVFDKMVLLQERSRRIDAEARLLSFEKAETEKAIQGLMADVEKSKPDAGNGLAAQVAAVSGNAQNPTA